MGRLGRGLFSCLELRGGSPHLCGLRTDRLALLSKFELCTGAYGIFFGPVNLLASTVTELDDTPPCFTGVQKDSVWATDGVSVEAYLWKTALGYGGPDSTL
jgi:hypothetical protein